MSEACDAFGCVANRLAAWVATLAMDPLLAPAADVGERAIGEDAPALHVDADVDADVTVVVAYIALFTLFKGGRPAETPGTPTLPALVRESYSCWESTVSSMEVPARTIPIQSSACRAYALDRRTKPSRMRQLVCSRVHASVNALKPKEQGQKAPQTTISLKPRSASNQSNRGTSPCNGKNPVSYVGHTPCLWDLKFATP